MKSLLDGYRIESAARSSNRRDDARPAAAIAEACFHRAHDPTQIAINDATMAWLLGALPAYWNPIQYRDAAIGSTLILPTSQALMQEFLRAELTEAALLAARGLGLLERRSDAPTG